MPVTSLYQYNTSASVKDWCMFPHGIAGPPDQSSSNSGSRWRLARPLTLPNFITLRQKVYQIYAFKTLGLPGGRVNLDQSSPKSQKTSYGPMPIIVPISSRLAKRCTKKTLQKCLYLQYFGTQGQPWAKANDAPWFFFKISALYKSFT